MITAKHIDKNSIEEHDDIYRLRFQVYCNETKFLNPEDYPDGKETDEYDSIAEHFSVVADGTTIGTSRLVGWTEDLQFPSMKYFPNIIQQINRLHFPLESTSEISRLCVSKNVRRRNYDGMVEWSAYDPSDRRKDFPSITLKLFNVMYRACKSELGVTHFIATFEDALYRSLNKLGIQFSLLARDAADYYGRVKIYGAAIEHLEESMKHYRPDLYEFFQENIDDNEGLV